MRKILVDILVITASIYLAIYLAHSGFIATLVALAGNNILLVSLVTGFFFTSFFTTPPAIAIFTGLAGQENIFLVASLGGLGAVLGDSLLFLFVRDRVAKDASALMTGPKWKRVLRVLKRRHFRRILPVMGALIIASPLPDEIGLALIGVSRLTRPQFFVLSYCMNTLGIFVILLLAGAL